MTFAFSRDAPQKPIKISLKLFFESSLQTELLLCLSLRMNVQLLPSQKQLGLLFLFCLFIGKFLFLVPAAGKNG